MKNSHTVGDRGGSDVAEGSTGNVRGETGLLMIWRSRDDEAGACYEVAIWKVATGSGY